MSLPILQKLLRHPHLIAANTVMMYCSMPDEVHTHEALDHLVAMGKHVLLPVVTGEETMEVREYRGKNDLQKSAFGIFEPTGSPFTDYEQIDLVVVPGMAFDAHGNRLGRGRGYYDRFLRALPHVYKIGICFDFQKQPYIPTDANDVKMDEVL